MKKKKKPKVFLKNAIQNFKNVDKLVVLFVAFLSVIGMVTIYSITSVTFYNSIYENPLAYVNKQLFGLIVGFIGVTVILFIPYRLLKMLGLLAIYACPIIMIIVLLIGTGPGDVKSWIGIGPLSLQPVELVKIGLILAVAWFVSEIPQYYRHLTWKKIFTTFVEPIPFIVKIKRWFLSPWGVLAYTAVLLLLAMKQPDLGSGLILAAIGIVMVLCSGISWKTFFQISFIVTIGFVAVWNIKDVLLKEHQLNRFLMWKDPFAYEQEIGYQNIMGYVAIANGGISGRGVGDGVQKYGYMSEPHNDFIVSIVAEELGLVTVIAIILVYFLMSFRIMRTALKTRDLFASLTCIGIGISFLVQAIINLGGVSGTIPLTGVTLPFISYGGTSVMSSLLMLGVYFNVRSYIIEDNKRIKLEFIEKGRKNNEKKLQLIK